MKTPANMKLANMMLQLINSETSRIATTSTMLPDPNARIATPINGYILIPTNESNYYTITHGAIKKSVIMSYNSIPATKTANYRAIFIITENSDAKTTIETALFRADTLAIQCDDIEGDCIFAVGPNSDVALNLSNHPIYTRGKNPQTGQAVTYVQYCDFSKLKLSIDTNGIPINLDTPPDAGAP